MEVGKILGSIELFQLICVTRLRNHYVQNNGASVQKNPVTALLAFNSVGSDAVPVEGFAYLFGNGCGVTGRGAGADHVVVGNVGTVADVYDADVSALNVFYGTGNVFNNDLFFQFTDPFSVIGSLFYSGERCRAAV